MNSETVTIAKGGKVIQVSAANWRSGWLKARGWKVEAVKPKVTEPSNSTESKVEPKERKPKSKTT